MLRNASKADARRVLPTLAEWARISAGWGLSARETDVVRLLASGQSRKEAARTLEISISTLQTHLRRALWKSRTDDLIGLIWAVVGQLERLRAS